MGHPPYRDIPGKKKGSRVCSDVYFLFFPLLEKSFDVSEQIKEVEKDVEENQVASVCISPDGFREERRVNVAI